MYKIIHYTKNLVFIWNVYDSFNIYVTTYYEL